MKVLFVVSALGFGGAETQILLLSRELARRGHQVTIYSLSRETSRADELCGSGVQVIVDHKRWRLDPAVLARLRRYIRRWRPDLVHGFLYDGNLYARLAAWGAGVPVLNSERSHNYRLSLLQRIGYRLTGRLCDAVVANSHAGGEFARRLHRLPQDRVPVVWNGIDLGVIDERLAGSCAPAREIFPGPVKRLCMVGSLQPGKDYPLALRVMRRLLDRDPSWRMICVGDVVPGKKEHYKAHVLAERDRLGLEPFVRFVGNRRDVPEIMASSDLLLMTSVNEGFPNVVLEAMASGTAVVSTDYSDVRRILPGAQVVGSRNEGDIAQAVEACHSARARLAAAQRRWVEQNATAAASASALIAVYEKFTAGAGRRLPPLEVRDAPASRGILESYLRRVGQGARVVEAGCGRQWPLQLEGLHMHLTGIDTDAAAIGARRDLDQAIVGDLRDRGLLPRGAFDLVYSSFVLEHVAGAERALENFLDWLRPGGLLILRVPDRSSGYGFAARITPFRLHVLYKRWVERMPNAGKPGFDPYPTHYDRVISRRGIHDFCRRHGCRIVEEYGTGTYLRGAFGGLKGAVALALWALSFGRLAWRHNNLTYVIERGPVPQPARVHLQQGLASPLRWLPSQGG